MGEHMKKRIYAWLTICLLLLPAACEAKEKQPDNLDSTDATAPFAAVTITPEPEEEQRLETVWLCAEMLDFAMQIPKELGAEPKKEGELNYVFEGNSDSLSVSLQRWDQVSKPDTKALAELITRNNGQKTEIVSRGGRELVKVDWPHGEVNYYLLSENGDAYVLWITPYVMRDPDVYWKVKQMEESICSIQNVPKGEESVQTESISSKEIDYYVLIDKKHALPEGWEENLDLVSMVNSVGDTVRTERQAYKAYLELKDDLLENEGIDVDLDSAYRSVAYQQEIMDRFTEKYGAAYARRTVATPGYSEHHTGLALDLYFRLDGVEVYENEDLVKYPEVWKKIHARLADHGFILRYPGRTDGTVDYTYEPWHVRYVGSAEAAKEIMAMPAFSFEDWLAAR